MVPRLAAAYRVIRVDLFGHGRSASPAGGYDIPTQARRVGAALDRLRVGRAVVIGHSTGGSVATALAEQRPDLVAALALIDTGPDPDAFIPQGLLSRLLLAPLPGRLLWPLRTEATIRRAMRTAFTPPVDIPDARVELLPGVGHPDAGRPADDRQIAAGLRRNRRGDAEVMNHRPGARHGLSGTTTTSHPAVRRRNRSRRGDVRS